MKPKSLDGQMQRVLKETKKLGLAASANAHVASRIEQEAIARTRAAKERLLGARSGMERAAAEADYAQALQDRHIAVVCGAASAMIGTG